MRLDPLVEERLKAEVLKILEHGRPGWDVPHTLAAVHWMKELLKGEDGDERVLIPAIYLHDVGYSKVLKKEKKGSYDSVKDAKDDHMKHGVEIAKELLESFDFSDSEKEEIFHLVAVHDLLEQLSSRNEILIQEADALSQIDTERAKPTFSPEEKKRFIRTYEMRRVPCFRTKTGKHYLELMLPKIKKMYGVA
ncbi:HD domain-containing protein [Candidatus Woesearchaeota archaeon]|nr:HD domain-containing protein [Candidatus Woesearchaeota archaeon]